jgi:uncharacterized membrane protein (UPF0127 family)
MRLRMATDGRPARADERKSGIAGFARLCARRWHAAALGIAVATLAACSGTSAGPAVTVHAGKGDAKVNVELALTPETQMRGLMFRTELDENAGMLFVFPEEKERTFWMSNTPIPLDIIYIRSDATIVSIAANTVPYSERTIPSRGAARYVLEVPGGWAERHGVKAGDRLTLPQVASAPGD